MSENSGENPVLADTGNIVKKTLSKYLLDATLLIAFLTAISYFYAYAYKKGFYSFYGISDLNLEDVGTLDLMEVSQALVNLLFFIALAYILFTGTLITSNVESRFFFRTLLFSSLFWCFIGSFISIDNSNALELFILVILTTFFLWLGKICLTKLFAVELEKVRSNWRKNKSFSLIIGALLLGGIYYSMIQFGQAQAQQKSEYLVLENKAREKYVVIQQTKSYFILSRLLSEDGDIAKRYEIKEIKPNEEEQYNLLKAKFESGLIIDGQKIKKVKLPITTLREYIETK